MKPTSTQRAPNRRRFLKLASPTSTAVLAGPLGLWARATADAPIRIGLIGTDGGLCSLRGVGAVRDALAAGPNVQLIAIAALFSDHLQSARDYFASGQWSEAAWRQGLSLEKSRSFGFQVDPARCFSGRDAYRQLLTVPEVNYVVIADVPCLRPSHLRAAIEAGKHCFVEIPVAVDVPGCRSVIESGELARRKGLGIVAGTWRRHAPDYRATVRRLQEGAVGRILAARTYWNQGYGRLPIPRRSDWSDTEHQLRNWSHYLWTSGDSIVYQHLHNLDVVNWVLDTHPVKAHGMGGRQVRADAESGNVYDHFAVEFEYPAGQRLTSLCRQIDGCSDRLAEAVEGELGSSNCRNFINDTSGRPRFTFTDRTVNPWHQEHLDLIQSIRTGSPLNEARQVAESTLTAILGREAAYSGQLLDWDSLLASETCLAPTPLEFGPRPVTPAPMPGRYRFS